MDLASILKTLERLAPLKLAKSWDNVGLLVEPAEKITVKRVMLTNDFTEPVLKEAVAAGVDMVITYHPLIFRGFKRLASDWKSRIVATCLRHNIAVYSPHTAWDCVRGGSSDWLLEAFEPIGYDTSRALDRENGLFYLVDVVAGPDPSKINCAFTSNNVGAEFRPAPECRARWKCRKEDLAVVLNILNSFDVQKPIISPEKKPGEETGGGRYCSLKRSTTLEEVVPLIKQHLNLEKIRVAAAVNRDDPQIKKVGVCCGSGASLLNGNAKIDLYLTGEMSHHEVLDAVHSGVHVVLCDHSNTERGFLPRMKKILEAATTGSGVEFVVSECDTDPLKIV